MSYAIGLDLGSTSVKAVVLSEDGRDILYKSVIPTGWSSYNAAQDIKRVLIEKGFYESGSKVIATGYGRVSVPFADKIITEISCHGKGVCYLFGEDCTIIDIGGQDTKIIKIQSSKIEDFLMNDKCSSGTGRFLEIMSSTLGVSLEQLFSLAETGSGVHISSMCTVFAESEVIGLIGSGCPRSDIAYAVCESIINKVVSICAKQTASKKYYLSGGLCDSGYFRRRLSEILRAEVATSPAARYAGALGAAIFASEINKGI